MLEESLKPIDQVRSFEFNVTKPYKFFKFECQGLNAIGLSEIEIFEATSVNDGDMREYLDHIVRPMFTKNNTNILPILGQTASASSQYVPWGSGADMINAYDNNANTQWLVGTGGKRSWIKVELPSEKQI